MLYFSSFAFYPYLFHKSPGKYRNFSSALRIPRFLSQNFENSFALYLCIGIVYIWELFKIDTL